jgi:hypothetical protein
MKYAFLAVALAACGAAPKPSAAPPPAASRTSADLVVDDRGQAPHHDLRYRAVAGTRRETTATVQMGDLAGQQVSMNPSMTLSGTLEVVDVAADGTATLEVHLERTDPHTARYDARGRILDGATTQSGGVPGMGVDLLQLPDVPVGVGARWTVRGRAADGDTDNVTTTQVELVSLDGNRVHVHYWSESMTEPSTAPILQRVRAEGDVSIDLTTLVGDANYGATVETIEGGEHRVVVMATELVSR